MSQRSDGFRPRTRAIARIILGVVSLLILGLSIFAGPAISRFMTGPYLNAEAVIARPFHTRVKRTYDLAGGPSRITRVGYDTYSHSGFGILDLGDVRIAVEGWIFTGGSMWRCAVASTGSNRTSRVSGAGKFAYAFDDFAGTGRGQFGALEFVIRDGVLKIDGQEFRFGEGSRCVFATRGGRILSIDAPPTYKRTSSAVSLPDEH